MNWTILDYQARTILEHHALEDALFEALCADALSPTIVFSQISTPGISLGANQSTSDVRLEDATRDGLVVVERHSGGRAMLLGPKYLVVSFFTKQGTSSRDAYQQILETYIVRPLEEAFGFSVTIENVNDLVIQKNKQGIIGQQTGIDPFLLADSGSFHSRKFGGAAARKERDAIFVHCYLRLEEDNRDMLRYITLGGIDLLPYHSQIDLFATSLTTLVNTPVFFNQVRTVILNHLEKNGGACTHTTLSEELALAVQLKAEQYATNNSLFSRQQVRETQISRGHCDIIGGSGPTFYYKIPELESLVRQRGIVVK